MNKTNKILSLESLRGLAAISVALSHLSYNSPLVANLFIKNAYLMVDFFFVLSGFVIAMNYSHRINTASDFRLFIARRFWRLYPLHIATLLVFLLLEITKFVLVNLELMSAFSPAFTNNNFNAFLAHIFLIQGFTGFELTFNGPSWSISTEFFTYLLFGLIILRLPKLYLIIMICIAFLSAITLAYLDFTEFSPLLLIRCFWGFLIGSIGFYFYKRYTFNVSAFFTLLSLLLSIYIVCIGDEYKPLFPLFFMISILFICNTDQNSIIIKLLNIKPLVYLGTISYSIYMNHMILWYLTSVLMIRSSWFQITYNEYGAREIILTPIESSAIVIFLSCILVFISSLTYKFIEQKLQNGFK